MYGSACINNYMFTKPSLTGKQREQDCVAPFLKIVSTCLSWKSAFEILTFTRVHLANSSVKGKSPRRFDIVHTWFLTSGWGLDWNFIKGDTKVVREIGSQEMHIKDQRTRQRRRSIEVKKDLPIYKQNWIQI